MTKIEFMTQFEAELRKRKVADAADIIDEYGQHFEFKMADGYSEEEIAARLGDPAALAVQFGAVGAKTSSKPLVIVGLGLAELGAILFFLLLAAWGVVMVAASLSSAALAVCLVGGINAAGVIPQMPYWCGAILGLSFAPLCVLIAVGCVYYWAFVRQLVRLFGRFRHNALASASGEAVLPSLGINPQFSAKTKRRLRTVALVSLALFAACFVLGFVACAMSAGGLQFWHIWGWFEAAPTVATA